MRCIIINSELLGKGDDELGSKLMESYIRTLTVSKDKPDYILLYNSGVKLMSEKSHTLLGLQMLEEQGVDILGCGTCITSYNLDNKIAVGNVSTMKDIVSIMMKSDDTITV